MTTVETELPAKTPWHDRVSDWFNAILIKEVRQAFKSRLFVATFMLLLAISWMVSVFLILNSGDAIEFDGTAGRRFFCCFYVVLAFASIVIVPFNAMRSLLSERDFNTYDLLSITALSPRQIVWGKLSSTMVQLFIFYSAVTPFIAFSSLMQGFGAPIAAVFLIGTMLASLLLSMTALMASTFARQRSLQGLVSVAVLAGLGFGFMFASSGVWFVIRRDAISVTTPEFWWSTAIILTLATSYGLLFQKITIAQLTFESDNRSTGIRTVAAGQFWLVWVVYLTFLTARGEPINSMIVRFLAVVCALHWAAVGLFAATEGDHLSRRIRRDIPRNRVWRFLKAPFLPGGARGFLYALIHLVSLWLIVLAAQATISVRAGGELSDFVSKLYYLQSSSWTSTMRVATGVCCYVAIFLGIAAAMSRWGRAISTEVKPAHIRVLTFLLFAAGLLFPLLMRVADFVKPRGYAACDITNPITTVQLLSRRPPLKHMVFDFSQPAESFTELVRQRGYTDVVIALLLFGAAVMVLVNLRAMFSGVWNLSQFVQKKKTRANAEADQLAMSAE